MKKLLTSFWVIIFLLFFCACEKPSEPEPDLMQVEIQSGPLNGTLNGTDWAFAKGSAHRAFDDTQYWFELSNELINDLCSGLEGPGLVFFSIGKDYLAEEVYPISVSFLDQNNISKEVKSAFIKLTAVDEEASFIRASLLLEDENTKLEGSFSLSICH